MTGAALSSFQAPVKAGFMDGTDGTMRTTWRRSTDAPLGFGWNAIGGVPYAIGMGGSQSRDRTLAATVASELATSNPVIATLIDTLTTNALGTGLTLSSKPDIVTLGIDAEVGRTISDLIETAWRAWSSNPVECDASGRFDIDQLAACFFKSWLRDGEGFAALDWRKMRGAKTKTKVVLLDPRQIDTSMSVVGNGGAVLAGVAFDKDQRLVGFMIRDVPMAGYSLQPTSRFVEAFTSWGRPRVIHAFELLDARQVRGLSPLVAALTPAHERESLAEFSIVNALLQTQFAATVESDLPAAQALGGLNAPDSPADRGIADFIAARAEFYGETTIKMSPGVINHLPPGDKLKLNKAQSAGDGFAPFNESLTRSAARAGGAMVEEISGDWSKTSFSASRLAQELPYRLTLRRRKAIAERFYSSVYGAWLDEAIETGVVKLPVGAPDYWEHRSAYTSAKWRGIGRAEPDRKKAAEAIALELELGLITFEDALAERGMDLETHLAAIESERALMKKAGLDKPFYPGSVTTQNRRTIVEQEESGEV